MMKDYAGIYDISTSWKKLKTLPLGTFERYAQPHLPPSNCSEEFKILRDTNIKPNKRKIMVLKSWMCKKQTGILRLLFKELDNRVVKKKQVYQEKDEYMKPYKNAKYIVLNRDDDNQQLCFGILKVSKITKTKITGNIIVSKKHRYSTTKYSICLLRQTYFIDSLTIGNEFTLYMKGCNNGVGKNTSWRMRDTNGIYGDIKNMKCIEREDILYYFTREHITPIKSSSNGFERMFLANNIKTIGLRNKIGFNYIKRQHNEFNTIKAIYEINNNRTNTNEDLDWIFKL